MTSGKYIQITLQVWKVTTKSYLRAHRAHQLGFELALEQVDNERVIPHLVPLPGLFCNNLAVNIIKARMRNYLASSEPSVLPLSTRSNNAGSIHLIWPSIGVYCFCVGFVLDPVQILVESIEQKSHELLGIVLGIACKLAGLAGYNCLQEELDSETANCLYGICQQDDTLLFPKVAKSEEHQRNLRNDNEGGTIRVSRGLNGIWKPHLIPSVTFLQFLESTPSQLAS